MKRLQSVLMASAAIILASSPVHATLFDRGGGLIYDDVLSITWLQDANYAMTSGYDANGLMEWDDAMTWADTLVYGGYSDWRLPTVVPQNFDNGFDGTTGFGYNITTGSEMGHLYYAELGNLGRYDTSGVEQSGWGLTNVSPFTNLQSYAYWSGNEHASNNFFAWAFNFNDGAQAVGNKTHSAFYALAVRDGDAAAASVPEPGTMMLMGSGIAGLIVARRRLLLRK